MKIVTLALLLSLAAPIAQPQSRPDLLKPEKPWETTLYVTGGPAIAYKDYVYFSAGQPAYYYRKALNIFTAGVSVGKVLHYYGLPSHPRGQLEYVAEFEPLWLAHTPAQTTHLYQYGTYVTLGSPPNTNTNLVEIVPHNLQSGIAVTPLLVRYRFPEAKRVTPYIQLGGGLLFTFHDFPQPNSSVVNFTPQVDFGTHIRTRPQQAIVLGLNVEHISNAELGNINHGVNVSLIFRAGYTWWH